MEYSISFFTKTCFFHSIKWKIISATIAQLKISKIGSCKHCIMFCCDFYFEANVYLNSGMFIFWNYERWGFLLTLNIVQIGLKSNHDFSYYTISILEESRWTPPPPLHKVKPAYTKLIFYKLTTEYSYGKVPSTKQNSAI